MITGERIKEWREKRGLSQRELGARSGVSGAFICQVEAGKHDITSERLRAIATVLHVRVDRLVGE